MKLAIVTLCVGPLYKMIGDISHPLMQAYADRIGAAFIVGKDFGSHAVGAYMKLEMMHELLKEYDRVAFLDSDILIRADAPNIFDIVPHDSLGLFDEGSVIERSQAWADIFAKLGFPVNPMQGLDGPVYYNTGVLVASRQHRGFFIPAAIEVDSFAEQSFFNMRLWDRKAKVFNLPYRFNRIHALGELTGELWDDSFFAHFAGCFNPDNQALQGNLAEFHAMAQRFAAWTPETAASLRQNIRIDYEGALGDIVAGEPLIRFLVEELYPDEHVTVRCTQPEVLAHLPCTVKPFSAYHESPGSEYVITPIPKSVQDPIFHICHPLDFMSIKVLKGILPRAHRRIKLQPAESIPWELGNHVLLHFGKTWTSKTFPLEYCNAIIEGLLSFGVPVALIGNWTVDVNPEGTLDLRGQTTLPQLFKAIADAALLISNDSSPVHIAGAFDKPCIMIPSCKHPDHVWPQRDEALNITLGNTFPLNIRPNKPREVMRVDEATEEQMWSILPEVDEVVTTAIGLWRNFAGVAREGPKSYNSSQEVSI